MTAAYTEAGDTIFVERPEGFEQVPQSLWFGGEAEGGVSPGAVIAYMALSKRGGREDRAVPKRATLCKDMGLKSVRAVDGRLDELIEAGWLLITPRFRKDGDQGQTSNHYRLLWTPITDPQDPRLVEHKTQVQTFMEVMAERQKANGTTQAASVRKAEWRPPQTPAHISAPPRASDFAPPAQSEGAGPAQNGALQESDLLQITPLENQNNLSPADAEDENLLADPFDAFWRLYPKKNGKLDAEKAYRVLVRKHGAAAIIDGLRRMMADPNLPALKYIPYPATWLRAGGWMDGPFSTDGSRRGYDDRQWDERAVAETAALGTNPGLPALDDEAGLDRLFGSAS